VRVLNRHHSSAHDDDDEMERFCDGCGAAHAYSGSHLRLHTEIDDRTLNSDDQRRCARTATAEWQQLLPLSWPKWPPTDYPLRLRL